MTTSWQDDFAKAQADKFVNIVCMKWGTCYGPEWVNRLYGMVSRSTSWKFRFVCFTDDVSGIRPEVECQPLPPLAHHKEAGKNWRKLGLMTSKLGGLEGMTLFLDLDVVLVDNIDELFTYPGRFCIIQEWKHPHLGYGNSSVVRYFIGRESAVLDRFYATPKQDLMDIYAGKEQNFLSKAVEDVTFWPPDWCASFSHSCLPRNRIARFFAAPKRPDNAKILVFYGSITPESALSGQHESKKRGKGFKVRFTRRRFLPAPWIQEYWCE